MKWHLGTRLEGVESNRLLREAGGVRGYIIMTLGYEGEVAASGMAGYLWGCGNDGFL